MGHLTDLQRIRDSPEVAPPGSLTAAPGSYESYAQLLPLDNPRFRSCIPEARLVQGEHLFIPHHAKETRGAPPMAPGNKSTSDDAADCDTASFPIAPFQTCPRFF